MPDRICLRQAVIFTFIVALLTFLTLAPLGADSGRLLLVCPHGCPHASINAALALAAPGDVVQVGPGIYSEHIVMRPGVVIRGEGNNTSIITGADADTVVRAYGADIGRDAILEGITIIAGRAFTGGGIDIRGGASPTIRYNLITANTAGSTQSYGGGIFVSGGSPLIIGNVFTKNYASWGGGAIAVWDESTAVISNNYFEDNKAYQYGGAINVTRSAPIISGNTIVSNTAYYGGGIDVNASSPELSHNLIQRNTAYVHGGGAYLRSGSDPLIYANSFMTNTAYYYGGGLYMDRSAPMVTSNSFQSNIADSGAGIYVDRSSGHIAHNSVTHNDASYHGGGVHIHNSSSNVESNTIISNTAIVGGGGLGIDGYSWPTVCNNTIADNAVGVHGGAVYIEGAAPHLINNMIARNSSSALGGGIYVENAAPLIRNNTIISNAFAGSGEGIYLGVRSVPTITNNIIVGNGYGILSAVSLADSENGSAIARNNVWDNRYGNFVGVRADNNLSADPLFVRGRDGAFYLSQVSAGQAVTSPAVDTGTDLASELGLADRTTAVHDQPDEGIVDLGYHYRALFHKVYIPVIIDGHP